MHCVAAPMASASTDKPEPRRAAKRPWRRIASAEGSEIEDGGLWSNQTPHGIVTVQEKETS